LPTKPTKAHEEFCHPYLWHVIARPAQPAVAIQLFWIASPLRSSPSQFMGGAYHVYIVTNQRNGTLYTGVTNDLKRRIWEHRTKASPGFTAQYGLGRLVYFEEYPDITDAIAREKQIKAGSRAKKVALIERENREWKDLAVDWFEGS
jgi:putative endonuclease